MYQFNNLTSNVPNVQTFNSTDAVPLYTVGQPAFGGIVAYILQPGDPGYDANLQKGLVATIADISTGAAWGCSGTLISGADGTAIGTGNQNTIDIMAGCATAGIAARLCGDLVEGGYSDWYLPSKDELNKLYLNKVAIGGFSGFPYWCSTEINTTSAWFQNLSNGIQGSTGKIQTYYVRAVRSFSFPYPSWQSWTKPNDAMLIHILCIGGGAGGGSGRKDTTSTRNGGGGGGSAAVTSMYVPAFLIPDTLYVQVGLGGAGGAAQTINATNGNVGTTGGVSYVALYPSYTGTGQVGNLLLSANGGGAGGAGTTTTGTAGTAATATAVGSTSPSYLGLGQFTSTAGQAGASSTSLNITIGGITCGGAGGGQVSSIGVGVGGGAINSPSSLIPYLTSLAGGAFSSGQTVTGNGNNGYAVKKPLMWVGGTGGNGLSGNNAGRGGNASIGSGGGGGGACGSSLFNSGAGGNGGDGIVIITSYSI